MTTYLTHWLEQNGYPNPKSPVVAVTQDKACIVVHVAHVTSEDRAWHEALSRDLSDRWSIPVRFEGYSWPPTVQDRIKEIWELGGAGFVTLMSEAVIEQRSHSGEIVCRFPSRVAFELFQKWGGEPRLRDYWPEMPQWHDEILTAPPATPDPAVPVTFTPSGTSPKTFQIGRGLFPGDPIELADLPATGEVIVLGRVINRDTRSGREGVSHWTWTITDDHGACRLKYSERRGQPLSTDTFPIGTWIKVHGSLEVDKFTEERVLRIKDAAGVDAPDIIRSTRSHVDLHVHTKMSTLDALLSPTDVFSWAKHTNQEAVAIVDHGGVQTYPELEQLSKKFGIQAIYGVEVNMVDDVVQALKGPPLGVTWPHTPLIVVDVETTGLSPRIHDIIELGAIKVLEGKIVDRFHRMVRPTQPLSAGTRQITGIDDRDVADAPLPGEVMEEFLSFADGAILVAHNARFDDGFIRAAAWRHNHVEVNLPVLDTLALARIRVPGLKSYGLSALTQHFKVVLSQHHRALADAEATAEILLKLLAEETGEWITEAALRNASPQSHTVGRPTPVVLLMRRQQGIETLYRMISASHLETYYRVPRIRRSDLIAGRDFWLLGSPIHGGELQESLLRGDSFEDVSQLADFYDYWEVTPPDGLTSLQQEEHLGSESLVRAYIEDLIALGKHHQKPVPAVSDAHYLRPQDKIFRDILAATAKGELHNAADNLHFRHGDEMLDAFLWLDDASRAFVLEDSPVQVYQSIDPIKPVPDGLFAPTLDESVSVIETAPRNRAMALYQDPLPELIQARLDKEIRSITVNGFSSIYYIAHRLVKKSLDDGYLVGSRGSVGSSLVATLLDITEVNPLPPHYRCPHCRYTEFVSDEKFQSGFDLPAKTCPVCNTALIGDGQDIPFETFLGFEGDKVPDIDLNFSGEYQPQIHRYTEELFGQGHVFRAGTIATVAQKTAYGLVRAWSRDVGRDLSPAELDWLASGLTGVKRTTGQHPGGLMVVPQDESIYRFTPVQHPADDRASDVVTTHFDYHAIEGRLLKLDLLGHDDPTAIRMLEDLTGVSARSIPFQDEPTMSLFRDTSALQVKPDSIGSPVGSLGIPEFGTPFVRRMLIDTRPSTFAELIRISGLSHGTEVWNNNAQDLIRQKLATLSNVIATRDDIMMYLLNRGIAPKSAFAISEAVRKGKELKPEQESLMRQHDVPDWYIGSCHKISYLFPKAHAAAYVMMGWRIAWFKVHYPLAYYATYFSRHLDDFNPTVVLQGLKRVNQTMKDIEEMGNEASPKDKGQVSGLELTREMLARGYRFLPVNLDHSHSSRFTIDDGGLRIPFAALPGLGVAAADNIIAARQQAPFLSIDDLRQRAKLSKSVIELLRGQGALDDLGETSQLAFF